LPRPPARPPARTHARNLTHTRRGGSQAFHSEIRSEPWAQTKQTLEHALAPQKIEDVFASIKPTPVGAGCVAQVFQGKLLGSSQTVVCA
jgi:hypothetical protein